MLKKHEKWTKTAPFHARARSHGTLKCHFNYLKLDKTCYKVQF